MNPLNYLPPLATFKKAIAAGFVTVALVWLAKVGITADMTVKDALAIIGSGIVNLLAVYQVSNKGKK